MARLAAASNDNEYLDHFGRVLGDYDRMLAEADDWVGWPHPELVNRPIAYFSMEYGLHETLPLYSGGLGVLAADHLKESSDSGLPLVGVGLLYTQGYFTQQISEDGWQEALNHELHFGVLPTLPVLTDDGQPLTIDVELPGRAVHLRIWELRVGRVPLYLLDSSVERNSPPDRLLTARLYWSDLDRRIKQQLLLGVGGVRALRALGYNPSVWHLNEGHAAFLTLERARELVAAGRTYPEAMDLTRGSNIFTTHTPVPAGNDEFPLWLIDKHLSAFWPQLGLDRDSFVQIAHREQPWGEAFSMGALALKNCSGRNAVSELHGKVSRKMWHFLWPDRAEDDVPIGHVTNGVHIANWMARRIGRLLSTHLGADWYSHLDDQELWA
jgi:starch phosphorylase